MYSDIIQGLAKLDAKWQACIKEDELLNIITPKGTGCCFVMNWRSQSAYNSSIPPRFLRV
jgi:hypothetical protein